MIPKLVDLGGPWKVLPPGIHDATLEEVEQYFATNEDRIRLYLGFVAGCDALRIAGCRAVFLNGSYTSNKVIPGDFDACWDEVNVDASLLAPVLMDFSRGRAAQKAVFGGEFFPACLSADSSGRAFLDFFQQDKWTGKAKGIVRVHVTPNAIVGGTT